MRNDPGNCWDLEESGKVVMEEVGEEVKKLEGEILRFAKETMQSRVNAALINCSGFRRLRMGGTYCSLPTNAPDELQGTWSGSDDNSSANFDIYDHCITWNTYSQIHCCGAAGSESSHGCMPVGHWGEKKWVGCIFCCCCSKEVSG